MPDPRVWVVKAGNNNEIASEVERASVVAIGWHDMGDLSLLGDRGAFKDRYQTAFPNDNREIAVGINRPASNLSVLSKY